ncbi:MAG: pyruvate kinase [Thermoleophilia bacterium]
MTRPFRRTRIVATLGPACDDEAVMQGMLAAGMDVARVNFSHGTHEDHVRRIALVRRVAAGMGRPVAVLQDLQGPKIRVGTVEGGEVRLVAGDRVELVPDDGTPGTPFRLGVTLPSLARQLNPGAILLIDDGRVRLTVESVSGDTVVCRVEVGGPVRDHKGVNAPNTTLDVPGLTPKDLEDVALGAQCGVDLVALSFVRAAEDITLLRGHLRSLDSTARVVAKIEKHEALGQIDSIIGEADAIMVARGDLGVEIPPEEVPRWQKAIIRKATARSRAVITATQMLESMTGAPTPTRAEASDVANAVYDGTAAVMLSGETAVGAYPVETVATMARIIETVEADLFGGTRSTPWEAFGADACGVGTTLSATEAISRAACSLAEDLGATAILTPTRSGATARSVSRWRPRVPIIAAAPSTEVLSQLCLEWGVVPLRVDEAPDTDSTIRAAMDAGRAAGLLQAGDLAVVTCGSLVNVPGSTDIIKIERA